MEATRPVSVTGSDVGQGVAGLGRNTQRAAPRRKKTTETGRHFSARNQASGNNKRKPSPFATKEPEAKARKRLTAGLFEKCFQREDSTSPLDRFGGVYRSSVFS
jgi:hypothetical protein